MPTKIQLAQDFARVDIEDFLGGLARIEHERDCDQTLDDVRVAIGNEQDSFRIGGVGVADQPNLADTTFDPIVLDPVRILFADRNSDCTDMGRIWKFRAPSRRSDST